MLVLRVVAHSVARAQRVFWHIHRLSNDLLAQTGDRDSVRDCDDSTGVAPPFKFFRDGLFLVSCILYAVNRFVLKPHTDSVFFNGYFDDLLLIPCALPIALMLQKVLRIRSSGGPPSTPEVFSHLAVWSVVCEWIGPKMFTNSRGDPYDVLAYTVGAIGAWAWWNRARVLKHRREL